MKILRRFLFGHPVLREKTRQLTKEEILSKEVQNLIKSIRHTLTVRKWGIGLAAPQLGRGVAISVIRIRPNKTRPDLPKEKWADLVIINPVIVKTFGAKKQMWEGCISLPEVFAKVPRYKRIELEYIDEKGRKHVKRFEGLLSHVIQHETDHLNGILFVDKVKDYSTFMSGKEYRGRVVPGSEPE